MYGLVEIAWTVDNDLKMMTVTDLVFLGLISFGWFVSLNPLGILGIVDWVGEKSICFNTHQLLGYLIRDFLWPSLNLSVSVLPVS